MYIPSEEMGDYEEMKSRTRRKSSKLFPLDEEGTYGAPPAQPKLPKPLPGYSKRERKPKAYASYAVSNECSMHAAKLEKNENTRGGGRRETPPRGKTPPARKPETSRPAPPPPRTSRKSVEGPANGSSYTGGNKMNWQNSLRGLDPVTPSTPRIQRRPSTLPRQRKYSAPTSPNRDISTSPERFRKQSMSPERQARGGSSGRRGPSSERGGGRRGPSSERGGGGPRSSTDWGYTSLSTFTANRKSSEFSNSGSAQRKFSGMSERRDSMMSDRKDSVMSRDSRMSDRKDSVMSRDSSSGRRSSDYARKSSSKDTSYFNSAGSRSSSPSKISLSALKAPVITEWDQMGILGLSSKMFKESTNLKESYISTSSSSSFMRRESVTTKVM